MLAAAPGLAQAPSGDEGQRQQPVATESDELSDDAYAEEYDPDTIEERVVLAGESDAVADFAGSDSVTGFNAADLEAVGAFSVADLAKFTPNLEIVTAGSTSPTFFIRGVGLNDFNSNSSGAVAIYQDDIPINSPALQLGMLFDMEQVNIQRGPQGTGPARNASAGAIKLYSRKPTGNYNAYLKSSYGRFNSVDIEGAFEAPIVEDILSSRFAFRLVNRDGFAKNGCGNAPPPEDRGVRDQANTDPTDPRWSICGDEVNRLGTFRPDGSISDGKSTIPEGLPTDVNDQGNWAARGTFRFEPTLDMEFMIGGHGGRRDEKSRLGQSAGTRGFFCDTTQPIEDCFGPVPRSGQINGNLGSQDGGGYLEPDVEEFFLEREAENLAKCAPNCTLNETREATNLAKITSAKRIATKLDKRPFRGDYDRVGKTKNDTWGAFVNGEIALPWDLTLTTSSGYDGYDRSIDIDLDFSPNILFEIFTDDKGWQFAQSLALSGRLFEDTSPVDWEVGGFLLIERLDVNIHNDFGDQNSFGVAARDYTQDINSGAGYTKITWDFWDDFTLDGGFRYNYDEKKIDYTLDRIGFSRLDKQTKDWHAPTGTVRLTYRFREDTHAYWKYTRGWKGGHFNATSSLLEGVTSAEPEEIDAFEVGLRGSWFDGIFNFDTSFFYYSYDDYQLFTIQQNLGSQPEFVVLNASDARVFGAEVDTTLRPWTGAFIQARFSWLESKFLDFVQTQLTRKQQGLTSIVVKRELDNSGNRLLNSPRFKFSLTGEQTVPIGRYGSLTGRYDGAWTDDTYYDATEGRGIPNSTNQEFLPGNTIGQKAFWLHNARLAYMTPDGSIELAGWVRNITNKAYKTFAFDGSTFQSTTIYFVGDPRTYGVTLTVNFF
jgi:outer membrane receptor protein involved in Fe transport